VRARAYSLGIAYKLNALVGGAWVVVGLLLLVGAGGKDGTAHHGTLVGRVLTASPHSVVVVAAEAAGALELPNVDERNPEGKPKPPQMRRGTSHTRGRPSGMALLGIE
jgi:hypothetical protein